VFMPDGTYVIRKTIIITSSYVVLRGASVSRERECGKGGGLKGDGGNAGGRQKEAGCCEGHP